MRVRSYQCSLAAITFDQADLPAMHTHSPITDARTKVLLHSVKMSDVHIRRNFSGKHGVEEKVPSYRRLRFFTARKHVLTVTRRNDAPLVVVVSGEVRESPRHCLCHCWLHLPPTYARIGLAPRIFCRRASPPHWRGRRPISPPDCRGCIWAAGEHTTSRFTLRR
jgi:hypothetical protein